MKSLRVQCEGLDEAGAEGWRSGGGGGGGGRMYFISPGFTSGKPQPDKKCIGGKRQTKTAHHAANALTGIDRVTGEVVSVLAVPKLSFLLLGAISNINNICNNSYHWRSG